MLVAEALVQPAHVDGKVGCRVRVHRSVTVHRLPGTQLTASLAARARLDHEHELGARLVAVDDRRRVLGLRRDVAHSRGIVAAQPSQCSLTLAPGLSAPSTASGTKKRTLMFSGGSMRTTGLPAGTHSPSR